jgi:hypothetical protein
MPLDLEPTVDGNVQLGLIGGEEVAIVLGDPADRAGCRVSWYDLARLGAVVRPITQPITGDRLGYPFTAPLSSTVGTLAHELEQLNAHRIVIELDVDDRHIRQDGLPRADARPSSPAVAVSFDSPYGPLRYATAEFATWQQNLRAIALALEALRKVDRYGVSKRGEQYRGWRELETGTDPADAIQTRDQAKKLLDSYGGPVEALKATHPDHGGDATEFRKVQRAREVLSA